MINNPEIYLVAAADMKYLKKATPYLETMNENSNVSNIFFTVDFDISKEYRDNFSSIVFKRISSSVVKSPNPNKCIQHGGFLEALKGINDTSVIIFTDTDIKVQRGFSETDLQLLQNCKDKDVFVNYCTASKSCDRTTLLSDAEVCRSKISHEGLIAKYPEVSGFYVYNTGVIAANYNTYCNLYKMYNEYWPTFSPLFDSYIKQQWLLSYLIQKYFRQRELPYSIHCNAYSWPLVQDKNTTRWCYIGEFPSIGFKFCIGSDVVVFSHNIRHESQLRIRSLKKTIKWSVRTIVLLAVVCILLIIKLFLNKS